VTTPWHPITTWVGSTVRLLIPDAPVELGQTDADGRLTIDVRSTPRAVRHVIGRQGAAIQAMRALATRMGHASGRCVVVTVVDDLEETAP
jgi:predicted RNA-binding protein YlqC (UPF0109 family)